MSLQGFTNHKAETQKIIEAHKKDFNYNTVKSFLQSKGGYKAYVKSLGGVFAKYADFTGKITTTKQLEEIADYVWGLYDIWGVDYSNGCSYTYSENIYKAYAKDGSQFYPKEDPKKRFNMNYAAFSFGNGEDLPGVDEMLSNPDKYYAVVNCGQGPLQVLKKAGLCPKSFPDPAEYPAYWKSKGYNYTLIKNAKDLKVGDIIYVFKKAIANRSSITQLNNWHDGGWHVTMVGERNNLAGTITYFDSGHAYTYYGEYRSIRKIGEKPYEWGVDWIGLRYNFGLKEEQMDISKYNDLQLAKMVWEGALGSGDTRKKNLGSRYNSVQHLVDLGKDKINEILNAKTKGQQLEMLAEAQLGMDGTLPWEMFGYKDEWCSEFVAYCANCLGFISAGLMPKADICSKAHAFYKPKGQLHTKSQYTPKIGDIAYFGENGEQHTAIVKSVNGNTLTTIDGNQYVDKNTWRTSHVGRINYNMNDSYVWGFANPLNDGIDAKSAIRLAIEVLEGKYGSGDTRKNNLGSRYTEVQTLIDKELKTMSVVDAIIDLLAQEVLTGYWGSGDTRKNNLTKAGYDYSKVQARVNKLVENSKPKEGWIKENNKWYYYKNNKKLTGLQYLEYNKQKNWYYFDANGVMQTGKVTITATFDSSGKLVS